MRGWRNCTVCTCWRPISDFGPRVWSGNTIQKISSRCRACRNTEQKDKYAHDPKYRKQRQKDHREHQAIKRREKGVPVRLVGKHNKGKYGAGRVKPVDQSESKKRYRARQKNEL